MNQAKQICKHLQKQIDKAVLNLLTDCCNSNLYSRHKAMIMETKIMTLSTGLRESKDLHLAKFIRKCNRRMIFKISLVIKTINHNPITILIKERTARRNSNKIKSNK